MSERPTQIIPTLCLLLPLHTICQNTAAIVSIRTRKEKGKALPRHSFEVTGLLIGMAALPKLHTRTLAEYFRIKHNESIPKPHNC